MLKVLCLITECIFVNQENVFTLSSPTGMPYFRWQNCGAVCEGEIFKKNKWDAPLMNKKEVIKQQHLQKSMLDPESQWLALYVLIELSFV